MNGRLENELKIEKQNEAKVAEMPYYVGRWYMNMKASRKTAATCRDYLKKIHNFLSFINSDVKNVTPNDITEEIVTAYFLSIQTKRQNGDLVYTSDSYQCTVWCCLNNFLGYLDHAKLIDTNYILNINKPKNRDLERINADRIMLTADDFKKILGAIDREEDVMLRARNKAIILLFMNTGMRKTALSTIMLEDIDFDNHTLVVIDKGSKRHEYKLNDKMIKVLNEWINVRNRYGNNTTDQHLFLSKLGKEMHGNTIDKVIKKYTSNALGHAVSPHKLRSGYCSILYSKTHDIEFVRRCVGHANVATTQRYIVTNGEEKEKASEIMGSLL